MMINDWVQLNKKNLNNETQEDPGQVELRLESSGEDVPLSIVHPRIDHVEQGHHGEGVEDDRVVDGWRVKNGGQSAVVDGEENVAWTKNKLLKSLLFYWKYVMNYLLFK